MVENTPTQLPGGLIFDDLRNDYLSITRTETPLQYLVQKATEAGAVYSALLQTRTLPVTPGNSLTHPPPIS